MNRRLAWIVPMAAALALTGCSSISGRGARTTPLAPAPEAAQPGRYDREAVPDAVMLPDQSGSFYRDSPAL